MLSFEDAQIIVSEGLKKIDFPDYPAELYDPVRYMLSDRGKRIRPSLLLLACDLFGGEYADAIDAAMGIEIFHSFTLVHDDLMDNSEMRRNKPSVHVKWNPETAILSGDAMLILAYRMITNVKQHLLNNVAGLFSSTALKVCEGQMMDMNFENQKRVSVDDYLKMIELKTSVLIAASLKLGAIIAETNNENSENIYLFGQNLGIAFQLQDDLLDIYGNPEIFGKKIGNDIVTNKKTYLIIRALELANKEQEEKLTELFSRTDFDKKEKINTVRKIYDELSIKTITEDLIKYFLKKAYLNLEHVKAEPSRKEVLKDFAASLEVRKY